MRILSAILGLAILLPVPAGAWGHRGHVLVGTIADQQLNANARKAVTQILGAIDLPTAAKWPDCVKSVKPPAFMYKPERPEYGPPCVAFGDDPTEKARMENYVRRNWSTCNVSDGCHTHFHYADIPFQRGRYGAFAGAEDYAMWSTPSTPASPCLEAAQRRLLSTSGQTTPNGKRKP